MAEGGEGEIMLRGGLFTHEFLLEGIKESEAWKALDDSQLVSIRAEVEKLGKDIDAAEDVLHRRIDELSFDVRV